jgi:hypothetical protein
MIQDKWLDYNQEILLIELQSEFGEILKYQYDGISCMQGLIKGKIILFFKSDFKWFNPNI